MHIDLNAVSTWPPPNYVNPTTHGPADVVVESTLLGLVTILLSIRFYTRLRISHSFGRDDVLIFLAYVPAVAFVALEIVAHYRLDWDRHIWDLPPELASLSLQAGLTVQILFAIAAAFTKLSVLALVYRITAAAATRTRYLVAAVALIVALDTLVFIFVSIFQCSPVSDMWTLSLTPQRCIDQGLHLFVAGIINTTQDLIIVLLPIRTIIGLKLPAKQRIIVFSLFAGGILVSVAGAIRTYFTWLAVYDLQKDTTWYSYDVMVASAVELFVGIICASVPATKPFFSRYIPRLVHSSPRSIRRNIGSPQPIIDKLDMPSNKEMTAFTATSASIYIINDTERPFPYMGMGLPERDGDHEDDYESKPNLNKPLPRFPAPTVPTSRFNMKVDRSFDWSETETVATEVLDSPRVHEPPTPAQTCPRRVIGERRWPSLQPQGKVRQTWA
ncbi:hypothetical protein QBC46DRAFT_337272 [Diplogelasinospora grovesii]|uniref:Rhodopsin domain-containing protein n=1 Tax=Diplogelasinospora grovesii TaxID=303347 RepID=A0AAN6S933_9PEZI|nr:hypothetical protein QBC46DRAFT_337272 [Diplogelasinospora grovesii]